MGWRRRWRWLWWSAFGNGGSEISEMFACLTKFRVLLEMRIELDLGI